MQKGNTTVILMSVRDEESYIDFNISYHLDLGFDYIFITNHCSTDGTNKILDSYKHDKRVVVIQENNPVFDHAIIQNKLLSFVNSNYKIDWFIFLDADEFLSINENDVHEFVNRLEIKGIPYATIGWANALLDYTNQDYTCSPVNKIDTLKFYYPWPERVWQEYGHFRKTIVKNHKNIEIVVSGHYIKSENNADFFGEFNRNPFIVPYKEARLLHFEFRDKADVLYKKWVKLATYENDSTSSEDAPWLERIQTIRYYVEKFKDNIDEINKRWFLEHRTFWGTLIPDEKIIYDNTLAIWYGTYVRKKLEEGKVNSLCVVRSGNLGDIIMTEPVVRFLTKYVKNICLATEIKNIDKVLNIYNKIYDDKQVASGEINCDLMIRLAYEYSNNEKTYIQGYMESMGFGEVVVKDIPKLNDDWKNIIEDKYILIAPFTSSWNEKKRNWGYKNFVELAKLLEKEYGIKCIMLETHYSFCEMISLIRHCEFFVGNDSGPAIIVQSFDKKSFIIFGATHPKYLHLSKNAVPIYDKDRHKLCKHNTREEEINCCEEFCMDRIRVDEIFNQIKTLWQK
jgi:hypothetical protein